MGLWEALRGGSKPARANLDSLFLVPGAAITLQTGMGLAPTGSGSVCFRAAAGAAFRETQAEVVALIEADPETPDVDVTTDDFGFTWLTVHRSPEDVAGVCTDLHAVNTALEAQGFGTGLLCSLVPFSDASGTRAGLVYLYKSGRFYPFVPTGPQRRDNLLELQLRDALAGELPLEKDLSKWLAVWGAPGL